MCIHSLKKDPSHSAPWLRIYIPHWPCYTLTADRDWKTSYFCLNIQTTIAISRNWIAFLQGRIQKIQRGVARTLSSYIDTLYFSENCIKKIKISKPKGWLRSRPPTPKSVLFSQNTIIPFVVPPKFCISIFFNFSWAWGVCKSQEKLKKIMLKILDGKYCKKIRSKSNFPPCTFRK